MFGNLASQREGLISSLPTLHMCKFSLSVRVGSLLDHMCEYSLHASFSSLSFHVKVSLLCVGTLMGPSPFSLAFSNKERRVGGLGGFNLDKGGDLKDSIAKMS